jgi:hypothetical protein
MSNPIVTLLICMEFYRTPDQTYTADDYVVDGIKIIRIPMQFEPVSGDATDTSEAIKQISIEVGKRAITTSFAKFAELKASEQIALRQSFPKACACLDNGTPHWYHITTDAALAQRPQEFHGNGFSEAELLGATDTDEDGALDLSALNISVYLNSVGDEIEAPPDKFMLSIGAA